MAKTEAEVASDEARSRWAHRILHCDACKGRVTETRLGRDGDGPLTEVRCMRCGVDLYIERGVWRKAVAACHGR